jgi:ribosomal-protein-alanine N-acetyltransferase
MVTYRDATLQDLATFVQLDKELFPHAMWSQEHYENDYKGVPRTHFFTVAVNDENQIVGYAAVMVPAPGVEADVLTIGVIPEHRKSGIGRAFMAQLESWAIDKESNAMMLEVAVENIAAIAMYESLGYSRISERKNYYGSGRDALVMRKELR